MSHFSNFQKEVAHLSESASVKLTSLKYDQQGLYHMENPRRNIRSTTEQADIVEVPLIQFLTMRLRQFLERF